MSDLLCLGVMMGVMFVAAVPTNASENERIFGPNATPIDPTAAYSPERGYGFESPVGLQTAAAGLVVADRPFLFSVKVPEGNYHVECVISPTTTIKAESRRTMIVPDADAGAGTRTVRFVVNTRTPTITGNPKPVAVRARETEGDARNWDGKLTLEFCGPNPGVRSLAIAPAPDVATLFLAGDSTVCDQSREPWIGWGQMLPQFFDDSIAVANHAESGRTLRSFAGERRWDKILSQLRPGDTVMIQFGHNDMKQNGDGIGPFTSYADSLRKYVADVRQRKANPILLTPMNRRRFKGNEVVNTFGDYPEAVRGVAKELNVPLIDLFAMSKTLYEAYGPETSKRMFVHFPANTFVGQTDALRDDTHFQALGGDQLARCVVQALRDQHSPLTKHLRADVPAYDPSKPTPVDAYHLAPSAAGTIEKPEGN